MLKKHTLSLFLLFTLAACSKSGTLPQPADSNNPRQAVVSGTNSSNSIAYGTVSGTKQVKISLEKTKLLKANKGTTYPSQNALEITVRLDNGQYMVVVQEQNNFFVKGDRVRIITTGQRSVVQIE